MQHVDRPAHVQALPEPPGEPGARMELEPLCHVLRPERRHRIRRQRSQRRHLRQQAAIWPSEFERAVGLPLDLVAVLVNRAVMAAAK